MATREPRLGVDIGRVIIAGSEATDHDTSFIAGDLNNALGTPPVPGAFDVLAVLVERFDRRVWLVSKCAERVERRTKAWLDHHSVFDRTGIAPDHLRFCRRRVDKAPISAELGLTHFIDDRIDVLVPMRTIVPGLFLFGANIGPRWLTPVPDWASALQEVIARDA